MLISFKEEKVHAVKIPGLVVGKMMVFLKN
jgi:hypothetical protein